MAASLSDFAGSPVFYYYYTRGVVVGSPTGAANDGAVEAGGVSVAAIPPSEFGSVYYYYHAHGIEPLRLAVAPIARRKKRKKKRGGGRGGGGGGGNGSGDGARHTMQPPHVYLRLDDVPPTIPDGFLRIVCISDTHNKHAELTGRLPPGDVLLHAGDSTDYGTPGEVESFHAWLSKVAAPLYEKVVVIGGNHELTWDPEGWREYGPSWINPGQAIECDPETVKAIVAGSSHVTYAEDETVDLGRGITLYASPQQPRQPKSRRQMAFGHVRGEGLRAYWEAVPTGVDILLTHTPPHGVLDVGIGGKAAGCEMLAKELARIRPRYHVFGHVHQMRGALALGRGPLKRTTFINAANALRDKSLGLRDPIVFDLEVPKA